MTDITVKTDEKPIFYVVPDDTHDAHDEHPETGTALGFWIYLMSDLLIFSVLFAIYAVLGRNYAAGPAPKDLFEIESILIATFMLLISSITYGFSVLAMERERMKEMLIWLIITGCFGMMFLIMEYQEFSHLIHIGATPSRSAFLSSFFFLVGTHGLHVTFGIVWMIVLIVQVVWFGGLKPENKRRIMCLSMFWHFLDVVWVVVFSLVYLSGVLL